jgi:hypothetical protein
MGKEEQRFISHIFLDERLGLKKDTLRINGPKVKNFPHPRRPPLTLGPQLEALPYESLYDKTILQRELEMRNVSPLRAQFLSPAENVARTEISKELLRIREESKVNHFEGIAIASRNNA